MNKVSKNFILILLLFLSIGQGFSQQTETLETNLLESHGLMSFRPMDIMAKPMTLMKVWIDKPIPINTYTEEEIKIQNQFNDEEDFILTHDPIPDSLETFPDNLSLPIEKRNIDFEEITPYTWKWVYFELPKPDGSISEIALRRPNWWILHNNADSVGNKVFLSIIEAGIFGKGIVTGINPNQLDTRLYENEWKENKTYRPITGWFKHNSDETWNYYFEGEPEPIGATPNHPFWSIDRKAYIPVGELKIGEKARTEKGTVSKLLKKEKRKGSEPVYNLEIYRDHNFHVGEQGLLVHNAYIVYLKNYENIPLGEFIGAGKNKNVYSIPDNEDFVIAIQKQERGTDFTIINRELDVLEQLKEFNIPVVEVLGKTKHNGQPAIVMKRYEVGSRSVVSKPGVWDPEIIGTTPYLNQKSIEDLLMIKNSLIDNKIHVSDLQFLIDKKGRVVIADPYRVKVGATMEEMEQGLKVIDLLIEVARKNN